MVELIPFPNSYRPYAMLRERVDKLEEDQAIFVSMQVPHTDANLRLAVLRLRNGLRYHLSGLSVTSLEDIEKVGVWVYKRSTARLGALGPEKVAEIRSRPITGPWPNRA